MKVTRMLKTVEFKAMKILDKITGMKAVSKTYIKHILTDLHYIYISVEWFALVICLKVFCWHQIGLSI